jgi:phytol kinase
VGPRTKQSRVVSHQIPVEGYQTGSVTQRLIQLIPIEWILLRISTTELRRRVWHMSPGLLPFMLWPIPHQDPISPTLYSIIICLIVGIGTAIYFRYRMIERQGESNQRLWAVVGYAGSVLSMFLLFPAHCELGMTVLAILAFGDGSATLGGALIGGPTLPWNSKKTIAGSCCFLLVGIPTAAIVYWGEGNNLYAQPHAIPVTFQIALIIGGSATILCAIIESLRWKINDNIRVGVTAAASVTIAHWMIFGLS